MAINSNSMAWQRLSNSALLRFLLLLACGWGVVKVIDYFQGVQTMCAACFHGVPPMIPPRFRALYVLISSMRRIPGLRKIRRSHLQRPLCPSP